MVSSVGNDADSPPNCFDRLEGFVSETASLYPRIFYEADGFLVYDCSGVGFIADVEDPCIETIVR